MNALPVTLAAALDYLAAGLSVIPVDGASKRPLLKWKPYQARHLTLPEAAHWFGCRERPANGAVISAATGTVNKPASGAAIGVVTGAVSGNLEVLDFDAPALFAPWLARVRARAPTLPERLALIKTQHHGYHVAYRAPLIAGNQRLARAPEAVHGKHTLIETRGAGGYVLAPPSPGYRALQGAYLNVSWITASEREVLLAAARSFDQGPPIRACASHAGRGVVAATDLRPGDVYNQRGDVPALLARHGWTWVRQYGVVSHWRRPGKRAGMSATFNYGSSRRFYCFSTNAPPFTPLTAYTPFAVLALLECQGDFVRAARWLARLGFGR